MEETALDINKFMDQQMDDFIKRGGIMRNNGKLIAPTDIEQLEENKGLEGNDKKN